MTTHALTSDQTGSEVRDIREGQRSVVDPFHGPHGAREGTDVLLHAWGKNRDKLGAQNEEIQCPMGEMGVFHIKPSKTRGLDYIIHKKSSII